jgi:mono/diheme cytochrome c family protein
MDHRRGLMTGLLVCAAVLAAGAAPQSQPDTSPPKADAQTFAGWRVYHETCVTCHGADAISSGVAPDLRERIASYTQREFAVKVLNRYLVQVPSDAAASESGSTVHEAFLEEMRKQEAAAMAPVTMPEWENHPLVQDRVQALYAYLRARASGALGPGKPEIVR